MLVDLLWAGGAIAVAVYMLAALLRPERF
ncbi:MULTISPECIES: potassium-transporting ATPase subunit F [unclassified Phenylobacterium]|nr:K(+)-transporting ATPase subunit F [Phenylobacterium sp.]